MSILFHNLALAYRGDMSCEHLQITDLPNFYRGHGGCDSGGHPRFLYYCDDCWDKEEEEIKEWLASVIELEHAKNIRLRVWKRIKERD